MIRKIRENKESQREVKGYTERNIRKRNNEDAVEDEDLATHLRKLLKITDTSKAVYPYDNPNDLYSMLEKDTDSSDDDGAAAAMQVVSESDDEIDIDPYWSKIAVDE